MPPPLTWDLEAGLDAARLTLHGRPDHRSVDALGPVLRSRTARSPHWLVVDLRALNSYDLSSAAGMTLLAACGRRTGEGATLVRGPRPRAATAPPSLPGGDPWAAPRLSRVGRIVLGHAPEQPSVSEQLLPVKGAGHQARTVVTAACRAWRIPQAAPAAAAVATELVLLSSRAASTLMLLTACPYRGMLYLALRGGRSSALPADLSLTMINALADAWGLLADGPDTVTWAAVRV
ncbi:STAS domain-containing protein [Actinoplanes sp. RD1]|uniref:hypothetical protein n=1 Tax=Actinoplanes sp. RD1 TaxID=3064538 RepID=UPI0027414244|nr:hypothetical protein [Actinoplanes sp. RD1]